MEITQGNKSRGFVYVATGEGYVAEAIASARQLKKVHPEYPVCLVTDMDRPDLSFFDNLIVLDKEQVSHTPIDKVHAAKCPYEEVIFIDTDTLSLKRIDALFQILEKFDLALLPETRRGWGYKMPEVPRPFAEFNTGVIAFRKTEAVLQFLQTWESDYWKLRKEKNLKNDQASFRYTLWNSTLRVASIPSEYHFLVNSPNYIMWEALLLHGRGDLRKIAGIVNKDLGGRVYIPHLGIISGYKGKLDWIKKITSLFSRSYSLLWKRNLDSSQLAPKKWWKDE